MLGIINGFEDLLRLQFSAALVSGLFSPVFDHSPIHTESRVLLRLLGECGAETGDVQQLRQVVYVVFGRVFRRKLVLLGSRCNASLKGALDSVARNIVRTGVSPGAEQRQRVIPPLFSQALEFLSIHPRPRISRLSFKARALALD